MKFNLTMLALSLGLSAFTAGAQTLDLGPDATGYRRFLLYPHLEKGFDAMARGDRGVAVAEFEQARALAPNNPVVAIHLAQAYRRFGESMRAEAVLREQLTRNPGNAQLAKALADLRGTTASPGRLAAAPPSAAQTLPGSTATGQSRTDIALNRAPPAVSSPGAALPRPRLSAPASRPRKPSSTASRSDNSAYTFAEAAYKASARGDHAAAVLAAREAVRLAPDNRAYRSLLVYELSETNQLEEADAVASQIPPGTTARGADDELLTRQKMVRQQIAFRYFDEANKAAAAGQADTAVESARKGIEYAPNLLPHRLQLVGVLLAAQKWPEAEQAANDAIRDLGQQPALLVLRSYALQRLGQRPAASADLDAALAGPALNAGEQQNFRLIAADAALAAGEPQKALDLLAPLTAAPGAGDNVINRRATALQSASRPSVSPGLATAPAWLMPKVICEGTSFMPACEVRPGESPPDPAYAVADAAYKAFGAQNYELAASKAREASELSPGNVQYRMLLVNALIAGGQLEQADQEATRFLSSSPDAGEMLALRSNVRMKLGQPSLAAADAEAALRSGNLSIASEIAMLLQLDRKAEARQRFTAAQEEGSFVGQSDVDTAYLALQVSDDAAALAAFNEAARRNTLPVSSFQDAAYVAGRLGRNDESVAYFKQAIDASETGELPLAPQQLFNNRRAVADRTRTGGVYGSLTYRGIAPSGLSVMPGATSDSLQSGLEAYWRPFGYGDGRLVELYGGLSGTLYSKSGLTTGAPSVEGTLGARVKPLADTNLVLALERRVAIGSKTQSDWLARLGYSWSEGTDLRVDTPDWWTAQVYAEAGRWSKLKQNYQTFEGQAGRSFRLDAIHPKLVIFPHVVLGADRNTGYEKGREKAVGAGVGTTLRYWFNEDKYNAPRSYWDMSLQYRGRISGDDRAKGAFLRFTLSY